MSDAEVYARSSLLKLIEHVFNYRDGLIQPVFYGDLAQRIGRLNKHGDGHRHGMGFVLGVMGRMLEPIEDEWNESIPHIQSLVVNKSGPLKDLPDDGIKEFWPEYPEMTLVEKRNKTRAEHQKIVAFGSRWNDVLPDMQNALWHSSTSAYSLTSPLAQPVCSLISHPLNSACS